MNDLFLYHGNVDGLGFRGHFRNFFHRFLGHNFRCFGRFLNSLRASFDGVVDGFDGVLRDGFSFRGGLFQQACGLYGDNIRINRNCLDRGRSLFGASSRCIGGLFAPCLNVGGGFHRGLFSVQERFLRIIK